MRYHLRPLVFLVAIAASTLAIQGCAAFRNPDGSIDTVKTDAAAAQVGSTSTVIGSFFGPLGSAIGLGIAGVAAAWAAKLKGEAKGYDAGSLDAGKPLPSAGVKPSSN